MNFKTTAAITITITTTGYNTSWNLYLHYLRQRNMTITLKLKLKDISEAHAAESVNYFRKKLYLKCLTGF